MLIGILSDSHGRYQAVRHAMALFDDLGVSHIIHCGDVGGITVFDEMIGHPFTFVWGNMDFPDNCQFAYLDSAGIKPPEDVPVMLTLDGKSFAIFHGHEQAFQRAVQELHVDYILHGHTHEARDDVIGTKRIINPGALHRARRKTVATLDTDTEHLRFHDIQIG